MFTSSRRTCIDGHITKPFFSIVIPTRNRPDALNACLHALASLDTPHDHFEVLVVNDGGVPPLAGSNLALWRDAFELELIHQPPSGPAAARNRGAQHARGNWLAFTDDDCRPAPDWLRHLAVGATTHPTCALGGQTKNALPDNLYAAASQLVVDYLYAASNTHPAKARFLASNNLAAPASLFRTMGGFDPAFPAAGGEDRAFCDRWRAGGRGLVYLPTAVVWHAHSLTLRSFWRQHVAYGRGAFWYRARSAHTTRGVEPPGFYYRLVAAPFTQNVPHPACLTGLLLVAQVATAAGYLHAASAKRLPG